MGIRIFPGSGEKLRPPSGPTRQDLGSSSSSRDRRESVPVMVDGLQVLTSLNRTEGEGGHESHQRGALGPVPEWEPGRTQSRVVDPHLHARRVKLANDPRVHNKARTKTKDQLL